LERFGVKTIFLEGGAADDPLSKLMHQITGAVAEFERAKITERYRRGKLYRARCGEIVSPDVPFGYVKIPRRDGVPAHAEIQEAEAVIVRRIFESYVKQNVTVRQIAKQLTLNRIPTPRNSGQWSWSAVDRILHEEAYIGTYYYNRKQCVPIEGAYGKKRQRFKCTLRPKEEWIPISVPPIIDLATFHAAAGRARENEAFSPRNLQEGGYLLRKLVRCGRCESSCSALTSKQTYRGKAHSSHYYGCLRTTSGFLKQERCSQRRIRADVLDELVWDEVSTRLQDPTLVLEAHQTHQTQRRDSADEDGSSEKDQRLQAQIKLANRELSRLLDAYQGGALELPELQKRRQLVNSKLEMLNREQELLRKMAAEQKKETDIKASLAEFAALVSTSLKRISFENKQKLLRMVLDRVVVNDWNVDVHYNIPLPKPRRPNKKCQPNSICVPHVDLCGAPHKSLSSRIRESSIAFSGIGRVRSAPGIRSSRARRRSQAAIPCSDFQQAGRWSFGESRSRARTPYVCPGRVPGAHILAGDREYFRWRPAGSSSFIALAQQASHLRCLPRLPVRSR